MEILEMIFTHPPLAIIFIILSFFALIGVIGTAKVLWGDYIKKREKIK